MLQQFIQDPLGYLFTSGGGEGFFALGGPLATFFQQLRWFVMFLDVLLLIWLIWLWPKALKYRPHLKPHAHKAHHPSPVTTIRNIETIKRWNGIVRRLAVNTPDSLKIAVIDADKLVDDCLKRMGVEGEHMADRLEKLDPSETKTFERIWDAHRVRNNVVHTPGFELSTDNARRTLGNYEAFLRELKVL